MKEPQDAKSEIRASNFADKKIIPIFATQFARLRKTD